MPHGSKRCQRLIYVLSWLSVPMVTIGSLGLFTPMLPNNRQTLALYITGLCLALSAVIVWAVRALSLAAHNAFRAGHDTATYRPATAPGGGPPLRLVHDSDH